MNVADVYVRLMMFDGELSAEELGAFVRRVRENVERKDFDYGHASDLPALFMACDACLDATLDAQAAWVRRGIRLGLWLAQYNREAFAAAVQRGRQEQGTRTKKARIEERDARIRADYKKHCRELGPLAARRKIIADSQKYIDAKLIKRPLTLKVVSQALRASTKKTPA